MRWLDPYFGDKYLDEINRDLIDEVAAIKLETVTPGRRPLKRGCKPDIGHNLSQKIESRVLKLVVNHVTGIDLEINGRP